MNLKELRIKNGEWIKRVTGGITIPNPILKNKRTSIINCVYAFLLTVLMFIFIKLSLVTLGLWIVISFIIIAVLGILGLLG